MEGCKECCISSVVDDMLWNGSEEDGNVRRECVKMKERVVKDT